MATIIMPTFRGVKSLTTVSSTGLTTGDLLIIVVRTSLSPHPSGAPVATVLGSTSKKIKSPVGCLMLPATESFVHYPLVTCLRVSYARECRRVPTKKVGMATPVLIAAARPSLNPGSHNGLPGPSFVTDGTFEEPTDHLASVTSGNSAVRTPVLSGPSIR